MDNQQKKIKIEILEAIKKGSVKMVPKWHFVLKAILAVLGIVMVLLVLLYIMSFLFFSFDRSGMMFMHEFGVRGLFTFFRSIPWILVLISLVFMGILEILVRRYSFAYRKPLVFSILAILSISLVAGATMAPFHGPGPGRGHMRPGRGDGLMMGIERGLIYKEPQDIHRGTILQLNENGFILDNFYNGTTTVIVDENTRLPFGRSFATATEVMVIGRKNEGVIRAMGVRIISE